MQDVITVITHKCHNLTPTISKKRRLSLWPMAKWPRTACAGSEILAELPFFGASELQKQTHMHPYADFGRDWLLQFFYTKS